MLFPSTRNLILITQYWGAMVSGTDSSVIIPNHIKKTPPYFPTTCILISEAFFTACVFLWSNLTTHLTNLLLSGSVSGYLIFKSIFTLYNQIIHQTLHQIHMAVKDLKKNSHLPEAPCMLKTIRKKYDWIT